MSYVRRCRKPDATDGLQQCYYQLFLRRAQPAHNHQLSRRHFRNLWLRCVVTADNCRQSKRHGHDCLRQSQSCRHRHRCFRSSCQLRLRRQRQSNAVESERCHERHLPVRRHNRLTQLTDSASLNTTFAYDFTDKLTSRTLPNGVATTSQYDGLDRLTRLTHAKSGNTLADFQYQFDAVSSITQMIDGAGTHNYTYDSRDRLTAAAHPNQTYESYTLDDVGNRTASHQGSSYSYQPFNRLVTANSSGYSHDSNGNLTPERRPVGPGLTHGITRIV